MVRLVKNVGRVSFWPCISLKSAYRKGHSCCETSKFPFNNFHDSYLSLLHNKTRHALKTLPTVIKVLRQVLDGTHCQEEGKMSKGTDVLGTKEKATDIKLFNASKEHTIFVDWERKTGRVCGGVNASLLWENSWCLGSLDHSPNSSWLLGLCK